MGKYLHHYTSEAEFQNDYNGTGPITAFTVTEGMIATGCNEFVEAQTPFDGKKFVFDREIGPVTVTSCDGEETFEFEKLKVFKNGNDEAFSIYYDGVWSLEQDSRVNTCQDFSSIGQAGDCTLFTTSPEYGDGPYHEPWVSYTEGKRTVIKGRYEGMGDIFDFYAEGEFELRETGSKDIRFNCLCL